MTPRATFATELLLAGLGLGVTGLALAASAALARLALFGFRAGPVAGTGAPPPSPRGAPRVAVLLPLRDERGEVAGLLESVAALDWPRDALEILVLDDSRDETAVLVDAGVERLARDGFAARVLRREEPRGFKAGALDAALGATDAELLLVLDADARPEPGLVRALAAELDAEPAAAFAQARWGHARGAAGLLARVQAGILDALFVLEQPSLSARSLPVPFNGTGGLVRRAPLVAAGGFTGGGAGPSVTEDLDLAYRLALGGARGFTAPSVVVPMGLPATMAAFRAQQARWVRGSGEVLSRLGRRLAGGAALPRDARRAMAGQLLRHGRHAPLALFLAAWPPVTAGLLPAPRLPGPLLAAAVLLLVATTTLHAAAARRRGGASVTGAPAQALLVIALSLGLAPGLAVAYLRGLAGGPGAFTRTPKRGGYRSARAGAVELALGLLWAGAGVVAALRGDPVAALGAALAASGLLWVASALVDR